MTGSIFGELAARGRRRDAAVLAAVPAVLLAAWWLPVETRRGLVFDSQQPTLLTAYTAHFVHLTRPHLLVNLTSYLLVGPTGYALAVVSERRREYLTGFLAAVLVLPPALSALNLVFVRPRIGYGFSGVAMGLFALLAVHLFAYAETRLTTCLRHENAAGLFFVEIALIAAVAGPGTRATLAIAGVAATLAAAYAVVLARRIARSRPLWAEPVDRPGYLELGAVGVVLLVGFPFVAFPDAPTADGAVLNRYTHLLGFTLLFLAAYIRPFLVRWLDGRVAR